MNMLFKLITSLTSIMQKNNLELSIKSGNSENILDRRVEEEVVAKDNFSSFV